MTDHQPLRDTSMNHGIVRQIVHEETRDVEFAYVDDQDARQGDYDVRVRQANDAMAWSSPIWVGGYPSR